MRRLYMKVLTAEGIYRELQRRKLPEYERARLQREFFADDHGLWDPQGKKDQERSERQDKKWRSASERTQTGMETVLAGKATGGEAVYEQVKVANRPGVDYRKFLRRFAVPREVLGVDGDGFDYGFYSYGLRLYGNMPLVEPPETREEKRIEDFVIAIDTSMKKQPLFALLTAALLVGSLTACGQSGDTSAEPEVKGTAVEVQTVETGNIATESTVTGSVTANRNVPVLSKVACKVKSVKVKAGDTVAAGDPLYTLDTSDLEDTYGSALTTYTSTRELLDEQVRQTQESYTNLQSLFELGAVSQNQLDQAKLGAMQAENTRKTTLNQMGLDDVRDVLNNPTVTAPISGTVSSVSVTAGVSVAPNTPTVVVSEIGRPQVVVNVSETLQPSISVGDAVDVSIPSIGSGTIQGTVASVASAVSQTSALYEVHIDLPEDLKVSIGMSEIAARAGIGKSTIYEYFLSKTELFSASCRAKIQRIEEQFQSIFMSSREAGTNAK